jgi:hypothetical protein
MADRMTGLEESDPVAEQFLLGGDRLRLRQCTSADTGFLYSLAAKAPDSWLRLCIEGLPDPHQFASMLWDGVLFQAVIDVDGLSVGLAAAYKASFLHGTAWVEIVGSSVYPVLSSSYDEAGRLLVSHVFARWPFRKLYAQHGSYEGPVFTPCEIYDATVEARLPEALYHERMRWDHVITAIWPRVAGGISIPEAAPC